LIPYFHVTPAYWHPLSSLADAVGATESASGDACIFLYPGIYEEQVAIQYDSNGTLAIYGSTTELVYTLFHPICLSLPALMETSLWRGSIWGIP
jgi:hypothetical protein